MRRRRQHPAAGRRLRQPEQGIREGGQRQIESNSLREFEALREFESLREFEFRIFPSSVSFITQQGIWERGRRGTERGTAVGGGRGGGGHGAIGGEKGGGDRGTAVNIQYSDMHNIIQ